MVCMCLRSAETKELCRKLSADLTLPVTTENDQILEVTFLQFLKHVTAVQLLEQIHQILQVFFYFHFTETYMVLFYLFELVNIQKVSTYYNHNFFEFIFLLILIQACISFQVLNPNTFYSLFL